MREVLTPLESAAIELLLSGNDQSLHALQQQLKFIQSVSRTHTGVGIMSEFVLANDAQPLHVRRSFSLSNVDAEINSGEVFCAFVLSVKEGLLDALEAVAHKGEWPDEIKCFRVFYTNTITSSHNPGD